MSALIKHEVIRLHDAHVHGIGWNSSFHQEVMWASHCDPLKQAGMPLSEFDLGCGWNFTKGFSWAHRNSQVFCQSAPNMLSKTPN